MNAIELFDKYAGVDVKNRDLPLMDRDHFIKAIAEILSLPVEAQVSQATYDKLQKRFNIYAKAINDIDDFLEYSHKNLTPDQIKERIMNAIDNITTQLSKLSG